MKRLLWLVWLAALALPHAALAQRAQYEAMIATHAKANLVPEMLVHRVIVRESKYQAKLLGRGGAIGLMQIKLATARALGYTGDAEGLRDPDTNLKYGVKYLAGAYRAAGGDHDRAVKYYAAGYYLAAKQQRLDHVKQARVGATAIPPKPLPADEVAAAKGEPAAKDAPGANAEAASK
jgi:soluble lytic murein transglycosylase-like protein